MKLCCFLFSVSATEIQSCIRLFEPQCPVGAPIKYIIKQTKFKIVFYSVSITTGVEQYNYCKQYASLFVQNKNCGLSFDAKWESSLKFTLSITFRTFFLYFHCSLISFFSFYIRRIIDIPVKTLKSSIKRRLM